MDNHDPTTPSRKRILIVGQYFAPKNEIAAVRLTNFAIGLLNCGWEVAVLTVRANSFNRLEPSDGLDVPAALIRRCDQFVAPTPLRATLLYWLRGVATRVTRSGNLVGRVRNSPANGASFAPLHTRLKGIRRIIRAPFALLREGVTHFLDFGYVKAFESAAPRIQDYDVVWVSYGPRYMVDVGIGVAHAHPEASLVFDIRDPIVRQWGLETPRERRSQRRRESRAARHADAITTVGESLLGDPRIRSLPRLVLTNGIEPNWAGSPSSSGLVKSRIGLRLFYGGRLYPAQRLDSLVLACARLAQSKPVYVHYAGNDGAAFRAAFAAYGAGHLVHDHGFVSRAESKELLAKADAAVLLSWNTRERDVLTGKVYELIASDIPIICLINGDHQTSALYRLFEGDVIRQVFSAGADSRTTDEIVDFLETVRQSKVDVRHEYDGRTRYQKYSYESLSKQLSSFLTSVIALQDRKDV